MLNKKGLTGMWDMTRQKHGITLRLIELLPENALHSHPIPGMRTPAELIVHMYDIGVRGIPEGIAAGRVTVDESTENSIAGGLKTRADVLKFVAECWNAGDRAVAAITDEQLAAMVPTPWGMALPGFALCGVVNDEYLHHRGQLYTFVRAAGVEPPMMWDFGNNAEAFRPKQAVAG